MKKLKLFYLPGCPHCILARKYIDQLCAEDPRYCNIDIELVDESRERAEAGKYDYWYVPCFYMEKEKLHEGHAEKEDVRKVFEACLNGNKG